MKIMATSFKISHSCTATLTAPNPEAGHHQPTPPLETPGHSWASLGQSLVGSLLLSPGSWCTRFCCALQESISQSCVSSGSSMVGLMVTSSKRAYAIPKSAVPRAPVPVADHCQPVSPQGTLCLSLCGVPGSWYMQDLFEPSAHLWPEHEFALLTILLGLLLCPWMWDISSQPFQRLLSYWGFSDFGCGVSPHGSSSKAQLPLLILDMGYLFTAAPAKCSHHS